MFRDGKFASCSLEDPDLLAKVKTRADCLSEGGAWTTPKANFDNALNGCGTLFEMMSTEGWIDVMNSGIDAVAPTPGDGQPMQP